MSEVGWRKTACILCSLNCGIELQVEEGRFKKVRGDELHPVSQGYLCQKAARLDYYQTHGARLTEPLRRRPDGSFEPISWETAIREVAARLVQLRDTHGGGCLAYYGGGGQGNHLGGVYGAALRSAMRTNYLYTALAQEKTGDFWVNGRLFGRQTCHISEDVENSDFALFIGTNPWQAHGIPRARDILREIARTPGRRMVVIDPRRTETAELAHVHLQLRPGTDAYLLSAMLGVIVQEGLHNGPFLQQRVQGFEELRPLLERVPIDEYARISDVDPALVRSVARELASAKRASVRADLGIQHTLNSTLNSYLEKLLPILTGQFGREGTNGFHTFLLPLIGHSDEGKALRTAVTGAFEISRLFPPNVLPAEIDTEHPGRVRGLVVDSANPMASGADTQAYRKAFEKLELLVCIDVAMTETSRLAHYILPAASQFEKWECTFFNLGFPTNHFHLREPILPPLGSSLPEPEIYRRLVVAMGELPDRLPVLERVARLDRKWPSLRLFPAALAAALKLNPKWEPYASLILYQTLGQALPAPAAAVLWAAAHRYAERYGDAVRRTGLSGSGADLGEALFGRILGSRSGMELSRHLPEEAWSFLRHPDQKIHVAIPEMLEALAALEKGEPAANPEYPFVLVAGERRSYNANTIFRDPRWRKQDGRGSMKMHPEDAKELGLSAGAVVACESERGSVSTTVQPDATVRRGMLVLPHGYGLAAPEAAKDQPIGPLINELTSSTHCDPIARTPYHKHVRVRLKPARSAQ